MYHIKANFSDLTLALTAESSEQFVCVRVHVHNYQQYRSRAFTSLRSLHHYVCGLLFLFFF